MPLIDYWKLEGQRLVPLLRPGERVLAYTATGIPPTGEAQRLDEPGGPAPFRSAQDRLTDVVERALAGALIHPRHADKLFSAPAAGRSSSVAIRLLDEIRGEYRTSGLPSCSPSRPPESCCSSRTATAWTHRSGWSQTFLVT